MFRSFHTFSQTKSRRARQSAAANVVLTALVLAPGSLGCNAHAGQGPERGHAATNAATDSQQSPAGNTAVGGDRAATLSAFHEACRRALAEVAAKFADAGAPGGVRVEVHYKCTFEAMPEGDGTGSASPSNAPR